MSSTPENTVGTAAEEAAAVAEAEVVTEAEGVAAEAMAASAVTYPVAPGYRLNVRSGPSSKASLVRQLPYGARVAIRCQRSGERVGGPYGTSDIWDCIAPGQYVSDSYVHTGSDGPVAPRCAN
ncbi:SH3 domain-containing protein [Streptomyces sp. NPDC059788]|uniref:SH3 domain-containing protein n=1 Tax=Streptomyces sp. NPDC059788 TaxID=3346948 RepID=UPI003647B13C